MTNEIDALLAAGNGALAAGDWLEASDSFRAALDLGETGEALKKAFKTRR